MNTAARESWWTRNWKWFVPVGCLTTILVVVGGVAALAYGVFSMMKSADVFTDAIAKARANAAVVEALGSPIEDGLMMSGNINVSGGSGDADLAVPLTGPKGTGTLYIVATKSAGEWRYSTLQVEVESSDQRIDLLEAR